MITRAVCSILVGREDELSLLEDALLAACRGEGSVVVLAGDAGMGKSRLCAELARRADRIGAAVMEGSCSEAELALPYLPFLEAIGNYLETADPAQLRGRLGVHAGQLAGLFPQLALEAPPGTPMETPDARLRLFEAILALLRVAAEESGLLLVIEDLHWADASTRELLDYVTRRLRNTRLLVVATYRRDEMHRKHPLLPTLQAWQRSRLAQLIEMAPLDREDVARMVSAIFDDTNVGAEFRDFIHRRSEGNPFVLEEMLKSALDRGDIYREGGDWRRKPLQDLRIPETVRDTILLRVERLATEQQDVLRAAAVLGRSFDPAVLVPVSGQPATAVEDTLEVLGAQQLLDEDQAQRRRYRFRHALTQEAIYDTLSAPRRERLHAVAADALRDVAGAAAEYALHLRAANRWEEAVPATMSAASAAEAAFGFIEAAALYSALLPAVSAPLARGRLFCRLGEALWRSAQSRAALDPLAEGIKLLEDEGEDVEAAVHRITLGRCWWEVRDTKLALAAYEQARSVLEPAGPSPELALAYIRLAGLHVFDYDGVAAEADARRAQEIAVAAGAEDMRIWSLNWIAASLSLTGDYETAISLQEQSAREAGAAGLIWIAGNALHNCQTLYLDTLEIERMRGLADRLRALSAGQWSELSSRFVDSISALHSGRLKEALEFASELRERATGHGENYYEQLGRTHGAAALVEMARFDEAKAWARSPDPENNKQDQQDDAKAWIRLHLLIGDLPAALAASEVVLRGGVVGFAGGPEAAELAVEAFATAGRVAEAESMAALLATTPSRAARAALAVAQAHIALAKGELDGVEDPLSEALRTFDETGFVLRSGRARLALARVMRARADDAEAEAVLRRLVDDARRLALPALENSATDALGQLGVAVEMAQRTLAAAPVPAEVGERLVTVMFADVRGYTAMTGGTAPPEMVDKIATYQRWAAQEVERELGTVDKFAGDAVMATFNVSGAQVDHAAHALRAAQALRDKAALMGLPLGVGIATGAAVVGRLADGANLSVVGQTTNLAARLQAQAAAGEILLSEEAYRRLNGLDAQREELELKGFEAPVIAYRVGAGITTA